ncbi:hypothetical protein DL96DRAFT_1579516 [Flagelloscypha sp. PMI_526]|nr:hypothetical protein DL96DRAFT_1579516 [Flagelloscypha sp. PMI_526]
MSSSLFTTMPDRQDSLSQGDDSDFDDDPSQPSRPGRKKNPNSQAARRDQNRIAQREFRLRKAQKIRDLEAKVAILEGTQDEAVHEMGKVLKDLMAENHTLRGLLKSLAGFIGEGAGGLLPKLGWDQREFQQFVNKGETDTAHESYERRKKEKGDSGKKRSASDASPSVEEARKRARNDSQGGTFPSLVSLDNPLVGANDFMRGQPNPTSPLFMQPPPTASSFGGSGPSYKQQPYLSGGGLELDSNFMFSTSPSNTATTTASTTITSASPDQPANIGENDDPAYAEAQKLIAYHLDNYKRNNAYCLPASLRPTLIQRTVPHESVVDRILHPELRDRCILLRGRFDLIGCMMDLRAETTIHGDDVLSHANWELSEKWLRKYGYLVEAPTLAIMNRWRTQRGESELQLSELASAEATLRPPGAVGTTV